MGEENMKSLIDRNKEISIQRQEEVEHNFEALVGSRKKRYCNTFAQIQRTNFFEDYYLLYCRMQQKLKELEIENNILKNKLNNK